MHASTQNTPFYVNGLRHPRLPTFLECDSWIRWGDARSSKTVLALAHHILTLTSSLMMPMSIRLTSKKNIISIIAMTLLSSQTMMTMLVCLASPNTITDRMMTLSLMNRKRKALFIQFAQGELNNIISRQQTYFCWLDKQCSISCRTPSLTRWTGRSGTLTRTEEY